MSLLFGCAELWLMDGRKSDFAAPRVLLSLEGHPNRQWLEIHPIGNTHFTQHYRP
jgi:hypothetical protein